MSLPNSNGRILIIDDDPGIREILLEFLGYRYECDAVGSAEEALALLAAERFELVVSDIAMPRMSGLEMIPHVRAAAPDTLIVMVSGSQTVEGALQSLEDAYRTTLKALIKALEARDSETHGHSERVVSFSLRLGRELGLDDRQLRALEFGSLLHDIGKIGVPDAILRKPSGLTEEEWREMRKHPLHGQRILRGIEFLGGAARVVAQHHERWDGAGYPLGLRGEGIDLNARIFAVADAFDAITSDRVYRGCKSYECAAVELGRHAGAQFDPCVVEAFLRVPPEEWEALRRAHPAGGGGRDGLTQEE